jgi:hypothetical protein
VVIGADGQRFGPFSSAVCVAPSYENAIFPSDHCTLIPARSTRQPFSSTTSR